MTVTLIVLSFIFLSLMMSYFFIRLREEVKHLSKLQKDEVQKHTLLIDKFTPTSSSVTRSYIPPEERFKKGLVRSVVEVSGTPDGAEIANSLILEDDNE